MHGSVLASLRRGILRGKQRLAVQIGERGFYEGRNFRSFYEFDIPTGSEIVIEATVPVNLILREVSLQIISGAMRMPTIAGGTPSGTFGESIAVFNQNNTEYSPRPIGSNSVTLATGGDVTGGTELDVLRVKTANAGGHAAGVGDSQGDERGVSPGTYYFRLQSNDTANAIGTFKARWEELE